MMITTREERGETIAKLSGQIERMEESLYMVKSQSGNGEYCVTKVNGEWMCECPDNKWRNLKCKHIYAVELSTTLRTEVAVRHIEPIANISECMYCGSHNIVKDGVRKNKSGKLQIFQCKDCHKYLTFNLGFEKMKHNPQAVTTAMQLYFGGESLRNTEKALELIGVKVSYRTILN